MDKKKVLVINCGWEQEPLLQELAQSSFEIHGIHYDDNYSRDVAYESLQICDLRDIAKILQIANKLKPDAVISDECDYSHFAQALVAQSLALPGPGLRAAQISSNKFLQRETARESGFLVPEYQLCYTEKDVHQFFESMQSSIVLKPIDNRGSFGVNRIDSAEEVSEGFIDALANSYGRSVLAEQYIEGTEITVDGYCFEGRPKSLAIATKLKVKGKRQVAIDIKYPGELPEHIYSEVLDYNERLNTALGYDFGMTHTEYIITSDLKYYLLESANRGGGVYTSELIVPSVANVNLVFQYVNDVFGQGSFTPNLDQIERNEVILKFFSLAPGKIEDIGGVDDIRHDPHVLGFRLNARQGEIVHKISTDANRHGFVIVKGTRTMAENIMNKLRITYTQG